MDNLPTSVSVFKFFSFQLFSPSFKGNSYTDPLFMTVLGNYKEAF